MHIRAQQLWSGFLLSLFCAALVLAQTSTGTIFGTVSDQTGAVLPQAVVVVKQVSTNIERRLTTNSEGVYNADNLQPGEYEVRVEVTGFQRQIRRVTVQTGNNAEIAFSLPASGSNETVLITSEAPQLNTTDYKIDGIVTRERIEALPLNGRNFLELAQLEPGVTVQTVGNPGQSANAFTTVSVGGISFGNGGTRISVDGGTVNDRVTGGSAQNFSQETVQEFQINTANFDLANGVSSFGTINIVSRGGGNDLHGSAFFFFRDHNMAAYPNLRRNARNPDPFFARRQSGFSLSGPIKKNKLFWFVNYEYNNTVSVSEVSQNTTTGDGGAFAANFNHIGQAPLRGKLFNARLDWKVNDRHTAFLRYSEDHNTSFAFTGANESNWNKSRNNAYNPVIGVTSVVSPRIVNEFRYNWGMLFNAFSPPTPAECGDSVGCIGAGGPLFTIADVSFTMGTPNTSPTDRANRIYQLTDIVSWTKGTHRIRFGFEHEHYVRFGSQSLANQGSITLFSPQQLLAARPDLHAALPASLRSATAGPITLADILRLPFATFSVGVGEPSSPPPYNREIARRNDRFRLFYQDAWQLRPNFTFNYGLAWHTEDGLRNYDLTKPEYLRPLLGANNTLAPPPREYKLFAPAVGFAWSLGKAKKTVIRGGSGVYYDSDLGYTRIQERRLLGPSGNGLVQVAGTGIPNPLCPTLPCPAGLTQFLNVQSLPTAGTPMTAAQLVGFIPQIKASEAARLGNAKDLSIRNIEIFKTNAIGASIFDNGTRTPYTIHATGGFQREIMRNMVLSADFVMRRGVAFGGPHGFFEVDFNRFNRARVTATDAITQAVTFVQNPIIPQCTTAQRTDPKAQCSNGTLLFYMSASNSRYTALNVKLDKRFANRYQFTAAYALARYNSWNPSPLGGVTNFDNFFETYGVNSADRKHRLNFSGIWELPEYKGGTKLVRAIINGWQASTITQFQSALPLNPAILTVDADNDGNSVLTLPGIKWNGLGRANNADDVRKAVDAYNADVIARAKPLPANPTTAQTAACVLIVNGTRMCGPRTARNQVFPLITLPANFSNGDTLVSTDMRITRVISLSEKLRLSLIGEGFNIFNIANLGGYTGNLQSADFGNATSRTNQVFGTGGPRAFQLAARLRF